MYHRSAPDVALNNFGWYEIGGDAFSVKNQIVNILGFASHAGSGATQLSHFSKKPAVDNI